ncbi:MAG: peptidoglycan DD-metalloendopeptidase family protein [Gammaproteobacteria bacterium]
MADPVRCGILLVAVALLSACATYAVRAPVGDRTHGPVRTPDSHLVRRGDTLYSIAFLYGFSVEELAAWNDLGPPYTIYRGQELRLVPPGRALARPAAAAPPASRPKPHRGAPVRASRPSASASQPKLVSLPKTPARGRATRPPVASRAPVQPPASPSPAASHTAAGAAAAAPAAGREPSASDGHVFWSWPAGGALIRGYHPDSAGKKGIYIGGKEGDPVRAAAAGKVVYSGSGLSGYGRLIIIKHNNDFLSAYAHNRKLIAREGQWVNKGEVIAHMGSSDTDRTQLHFEIRKRGRPVDPLHFLPDRQGVRVVGEKH